jgi:hypothetical protein
LKVVKIYPIKLEPVQLKVFERFKLKNNAFYYFLFNKKEYNQILKDCKKSSGQSFYNKEPQKAVLNDRYEKKMFKLNCKCLVKMKQTNPLINVSISNNKEKKQVYLDQDLIKFYMQ